MAAHPGLLQMIWGETGPLGRVVGAPPVFWGFWPEQGWEGALGSTVWGGCERVEHHRCFAS